MFVALVTNGLHLWFPINEKGFLKYSAESESEDFYKRNDKKGEIFVPPNIDKRQTNDHFNHFKVLRKFIF